MGIYDIWDRFLNRGEANRDNDNQVNWRDAMWQERWWVDDDDDDDDRELGRVSIIVNCNSQWIKFITWFEELSSLGAVGQLTPQEYTCRGRERGRETETGQGSRQPCWWLLANEYVRGNKKLITRYNWTPARCCLNDRLLGWLSLWYTCPVWRRNVCRIVTYEVKWNYKLKSCFSRNATSSAHRTRVWKFLILPHHRTAPLISPTVSTWSN